MPRAFAWCRRSAILAHRWLGIPLSLPFVLWFVSGIAMIWARGMPSLTPSLRLDRLAPVDIARVRIAPAEAAARSAVAAAGRRVSLLTVLGRPAYRFTAGRDADIVFADTGDPLEEVGDAEARQIAARFANVPPGAIRPLAVLDDGRHADQWSIGLRRQMPLRTFAVGDAAGTELYVSVPSAEVVLLTTRASRRLAWIAAIPHWLYFRALRVNDRLWARVVLWTSGLGIALSSLGLVLALTQMRTRYVGWMRWHYVTGAIFGVFTLTWVLSGWLSMDPIDWSEEGSAGAGIPQALNGRPALDRFPPFDAARWTAALGGRAAKEIELRMVMGEPFYVVRGVEPAPLLMAADALRVHRQPFSIDSILKRVSAAAPGVAIAATEMLNDYDAYYYDRDREAALPVLRLKFADRPRTWVYIDPMAGEVVARFTRGERVERWLYHGLHSLDFPFWYRNRRLRETIMVVLLGGGSILSFIGAAMGVGRLRRMARGRWLGARRPMPRWSREP